MPETTGTAIVIEAKMAGGIYALNRFLMTLQNKRMPVKNLEVNMGEEETKATIRLDCPHETARRYMSLLELLEDVHEVWEPGN
ncbi:MAG: hypothetical protein M3494_08315 [Actinomycetota bacterium]|jgi:hypothetical protein|nr:hypothetical protein [Actinomycetota bacterium]